MTALLSALRWLLMLAACLVLCAACKKDNKRGAQAPTENPFASDEDLLLAGLSSTLPDEQQFAMYFISHFRLEKYQEELAAKAQEGDLLAAVVLAGVHKDSGPLLAHKNPQGEVARINEIVGVIFGMRSAAQIPADVWSALVSANVAPDADTLWLLAQLDSEGGGPLEFDAETIAVLESLHAASIGASDFERAAALDALLGTRGGRTIDWASYEQLSLQLVSTQWQDLLRHAPADVWNTIMTARSGDEALPELLIAAANRAPAGVEPHIDRATAEERFGLGIEWDSIDFANGRRPTINELELARLLARIQSQVPAEKVPGDPPPQIDPESHRALLRYASIAAQRADQATIDTLIGNIISLGENEVSAILATVQRYQPDLVSDQQLGFLGESRDRNIGYWLLFGWPERKAVQESPIVRLVWLSPNQENRMLFQAYSYWLEQNGMLAPEAPEA